MQIQDYFTPLDWGVLIGYLALTTWVGHRMRGKQASIRDFFLGGRTLPWQAVCGSIIATEISGVTFIGVPGIVMGLNGDFTYLLWGIGSIIGRVLVGLFFVKVYYEKEIFSPYDYMGNRVGAPLKRLATVFFTIGSILAQSVRVLVAALPLKVVTGLDFEICIVIIGLFAVAWTLMGGMQTVIWTAVMQFVLFSVGGMVALFWLVGSIDGGWSHMWQEASASGKTNVWDGRWGFGAEFHFTIWVALLAVPFQNLSAFGVDQLNAQRMFCCRNSGDAKKALIFSSVGQLLTLLMLLVGVALFVFYRDNPPTGAIADYLKFDENGVPRGDQHGDAVFPTWIVTVLPAGLSGLILAGIFAAAISSLDSILAALSQTTLSLFSHTGQELSEEQGKRLVLRSKMLVVMWGVVLTVFTLMLSRVSKDIPIIPLAFGMTAYTMGPMLGFFFAALYGKASFRGLLVGAVISLVLTVFVRTDVWGFFSGEHWAGLRQSLASLPTYMLEEGKLKPTLNFVWMWPLSTVITLVCGILPVMGGGQTKK